MSAHTHVYFPTYTGLLTKEHHDRIGSALWEFLWCIDKTTDEKDGKGIVLYGNPVKYSTISDDLGIPIRTVKEHMKLLRDEGYIELIRAPYGVRIIVNKSKKFVGSAENGTSGSAKKSTSRDAENCTSDRDGQNFALPEVQKTAQRSAEKCPDNTNQKYNQKIKQDINTTTTEYGDMADGESDGRLFPGPLRGDRQPANADAEISHTPDATPLDRLADRYSELRTMRSDKLERPTIEDYEIMQDLLETVPIDDAIKLLDQCFEEYDQRNKKYPGRKISKFKYCYKYIIDHYERSLAREKARENAGTTKPASFKANRRVAPMPKWARGEMKVEQSKKDLAELEKLLNSL